MRNLSLLQAQLLPGWDNAWQFASPKTGEVLRVIATEGDGWDHVSVSLHNRVPTWEEMEFVKRLFFKDDEYAMQLHVPPAKHINCHPNCLHLWRPQHRSIPIPDPKLVGATP